MSTPSPIISVESPTHGQINVNRNGNSKVTLTRPDGTFIGERSYRPSPPASANGDILITSRYHSPDGDHYFLDLEGHPQQYLVLSRLASECQTLEYPWYMETRATYKNAELDYLVLKGGRKNAVNIHFDEDGTIRLGSKGIPVGKRLRLECDTFGAYEGVVHDGEGNPIEVCVQANSNQDHSNTWEITLTGAQERRIILPMTLSDGEFALLSDDVGWIESRLLTI